MLKFSIVTVILLSVLTSNADTPLRISCNETVHEYIIRAAFDSKVPVFFSEMVNQLEKPTKEEYLSRDQVCGVKIKFAQNCIGTVKQLNPETDQYTFKCNNGIHGTLEYKATQVSFSCAGPDVSAGLASIFFNGCKKIKSSKR